MPSVFHEVAAEQRGGASVFHEVDAEQRRGRELATNVIDNLAAMEGTNPAWTQLKAGETMDKLSGEWFKLSPTELDLLMTIAELQGYDLTGPLAKTQAQLMQQPFDKPLPKETPVEEAEVIEPKEEGGEWEVHTQLLETLKQRRQEYHRSGFYETMLAVKDRTRETLRLGGFIVEADMADSERQQIQEEYDARQDERLDFLAEAPEARLEGLVKRIVVDARDNLAQQRRQRLGASLGVIPTEEDLKAQAERALGFDLARGPRVEAERAEDERFSYVRLERFQDKDAPEGSFFYQTEQGNVAVAREDAIPWVDLDAETKRTDLWAIVISGKSGTSEGDRWAPDDIAAAREIVGDAKQITEDHVAAMEQHFLDRHDPHFMSVHPGKKAYRPEPFPELTNFQRNRVSRAVAKLLGTREFQGDMPGTTPVSAAYGSFIHGFFERMRDRGGAMQAMSGVLATDDQTSWGLIRNGLAEVFARFGGAMKLTADQYEPYPLRRAVGKVQNESLKSPDRWAGELGNQIGLVTEILLAAKVGDTAASNLGKAMGVTGKAGAALTKAGQMTAAWLSISSIEAGSSYNHYSAYGIEPEIAAKRALIAGVLKGVVELDIQLGRGASLSGKMRKFLKGTPADPVTRAAMMFLRAAKEGVEEGFQAGIDQWQLRLAIREHNALTGANLPIPGYSDGVGEAIVIGSGIGAAFQLIGLGTSRIRQRIDRGSLRKMAADIGLNQGQIDKASGHAQELIDKHGLDRNFALQAALGKEVTAELEKAEEAPAKPAEASAEKVAAPQMDIQAKLPRWEDIPDARDAEPADVRAGIKRLLETWHAYRDLEIARAYVDTLNFEDEVRDLVKKRKKEGVKIEYEETALAMLLFVDLRNAELEGRPDEATKYDQDLSDQQKAIINRSQNLTPEEIAIADKIVAKTLETGRAAKEAGIRINLKESYAMRKWRPEKEGGGGVFAKFRKSTPRARHRILDSIPHGWSLGKELQIPDVVEAHFIARQQTGQAIHDRNLILAAKKAGLISSGQPKGFKPIDHPNFTTMTPAGKFEEGQVWNRDLFLNDDGTLFKRTPMTAEPALARKLNNILSDSALKGIPVLDAITRFNSIIKHTILTTSLFHHQAFLRSYMLASRGMRPIVGYRAGGQAVRNFEPVTQLLIAGGVTIGAEMRQNWQQWAEEQKTLIGKVIDKLGPIGTIKDKIFTLRDQQTNFLFNKLGTYLKMQAAILDYYAEIKKHRAELEAGTMTEYDVAVRVAKAVNADFGGLHLRRMGRNPTLQHLFQLFVLAPDWTESNIQMMVRAFQRGEEGAIYRKMWARVLLKGMGATIIFNLIMSGFDDKGFWERYQIAWETGRLRWLDIDVTPLYRALGGKDGKRKYFSLIGHFRDVIKFLAPTISSTLFSDKQADISRPFKHKGSVLSRFILDATTGTDWRGREFTTWGELLGMDQETRYLTLSGEPYMKPATFGRLTGKISIGRGGISTRQIPSYVAYEARSAMPIPVQNALSFITGELDAWDALLKSAGFMVHTEEEKESTVVKLPAP